jgi:hypothetical protein
LKKRFEGGIGKTIVPVLVFLLAVQAGITFFWGAAQPVVLLLMLTSLIVLASGLLGDESGHFDFRQPWSLLLVFHIPFWVVGSWSFALDETQWSGLMLGAHGQINHALLLLSLGFTCIAIGYRIGLRVGPETSLHSKPQDWDFSRLLILGVVGYCACWYIRVSYYRSVLVLPFFEVLSSDPISTLARAASTTLPNFLLVCAWTVAYRQRTNRNLYLLCLFLTLCEVFWGLLYGVMKSLIFLPVFLPVLPYMVMRNKVPWLRITLVAVILIGVAYPYVDAVREEYFQQNGPRRSDAIKQALEAGGRVLAPQRESVVGYSQQVIGRVSGLWSLCQALQMEVDGGLDIHGEFYRRSLVGLVPRFLWKNKPIIHEGGYFSAYIGGHRGLDSVDLSTVPTSVAPTLFGSFFWNLGWWAVVFSSLALGIFSGAVYRWAMANHLGHPSTVLYYIAILKCMETTENEVAHFLGSLVWGLALAWLANWVLSKREVVGRVRKRRSRGQVAEEDMPASSVPDATHIARPD